MADRRVVLELDIKGGGAAQPGGAEDREAKREVEELKRVVQQAKDRLRAQQRGPVDRGGRPIKLHDIRPLPGTFDDPFRPRKPQRPPRFVKPPPRPWERGVKAPPIAVPQPPPPPDDFGITPQAGGAGAGRRGGRGGAGAIRAGLRGGLSSAAAGGGIRGGLRAGAASAASSAAGATGSMVALAGAAIGVTAALGALAVASNAVRDAFQSAELAPGSAAAMARQEALVLQSRMQQAARLEETMSEMINLQTELRTEFRELNTEIAQQVIPILLPIMRLGRDALEWVNERFVGADTDDVPDQPQAELFRALLFPELQENQLRERRKRGEII